MAARPRHRPHLLPRGRRKSRRAKPGCRSVPARQRAVRLFAGYKLLGVTRAANAGVTDEVATLGVYPGAGADVGFSGTAAVDAAATTTAPTALVISFLRVFMMCSLNMVGVTMRMRDPRPARGKGKGASYQQRVVRLAEPINYVAAEEYRARRAQLNRQDQSPAIDAHSNCRPQYCCRGTQQKLPARGSRAASLARFPFRETADKRRRADEHSLP